MRGDTMRQKNVIYTKEKPAKDIHELVNFLEHDEPHKYLFRGQIKDYGSLIPSTYRDIIIEKGSNGINTIDRNKHPANHLENEKIKIREMRRLIRDFGFGIGNIISQQYGLSSECIDITTNPRIAAFFATKKYPSYKHYNDNKTGIIYRFQRMELDCSYQNLEDIAGMAGFNFPEFDDTIWYIKFFNVLQHEKFLKMNENFAKPFIQNEWVNDKFHTFPMFIAHDDLKDFLDNLLKEGGFHIANSLEDTRLFRQKGGYIFPSFIHQGIIPVPRRENIVFSDELKLHIMKEDYAVTCGVFAVEDFIMYPKLEAFHFKHTDNRINDFSLDYLWPSSDVDKFFGLIKYSLLLYNSEYLDEHNISIDDPQQGLINKGYYLE